MSDASHVPRSLRERLGSGTEERLGRALSDLLDNPLLTGAIGRAFDAREKAVQAQEVAMGALNIPSAADIARLTRRLRSVSLRLEGIEESIDRLGRSMGGGGEREALLERLSAIEGQLRELRARLDGDVAARPAKARQAPGAATPASSKAPRASRGASAKRAASTSRPR